MDSPPIALDSTTVVVRGHFNPAIFSASWLDDVGLISAQELELFVTQIISAELAAFQFGSVKIQVTRDAFQAETSDIDDSERVRDFVSMALGLLAQTPISALGINRNVHVPIPDSRDYHRIGDSLMPKQFWERFLIAPGVRAAVTWAARPDLYTGRIQVGVEPSYAGTQGVFISYNDHYDLDVTDHILSGRDDPRLMTASVEEAHARKIPVCLEILQENWNDAMGRALEAMRNILGLIEMEPDHAQP